MWHTTKRESVKCYIYFTSLAKYIKQEDWGCIRGGILASIRYLAKMCLLSVTYYL